MVMVDTLGVQVWIGDNLPRIGLVGSIQLLTQLQIINPPPEIQGAPPNTLPPSLPSLLPFQNNPSPYAPIEVLDIVQMQKYKIGNKLGDGSFGSVSKAINEQTGKVVAIKRMKHEYTDWSQCLNLNEVRILTKLNHPNIVKLLQLVKKNNQLYFVFEYLHRNVYQLQQEKGKLPHAEVRNIAFQTLQALAYMHRKGFFHRDIKPENLLELNGTIKLADFGLAREIRAQPPFTEYVATRWYRAPETLLRGRHYNSPMDLFAVGAIMAELYSGTPLFPGSSQKDQIIRILQIMGTPSKQEWPEGYKLAAQLKFQLPEFQPANLGKLIPEAPPAAINLIANLLQVAPYRRMTAQQALQHEYFQVRNIEKDPQVMKNLGSNTHEESGWLSNPRYKPGVKCKL